MYRRLVLYIGASIIIYMLLCYIIIGTPFKSKTCGITKSITAVNDAAQTVTRQYPRQSRMAKRSEAYNRNIDRGMYGDNQGNDERS